MDIFSVLTLCGGLAFFLFGMHVMSSSLEKLAGGQLERILKKMTSNPFKSLLLGAGITIAIQSSSAMTVMLVGLVNSGIMQLSQTIGIIMGSNIGTTLTAWILSLAGVESNNIIISLLKPENFSPIIALVGVILLMVSKNTRRRDTGMILLGFSVLMFGMELMSSAVSPLADTPQFSSLLTAFKNPLLGVLVGAVFTGIIQSSAASVGILQALSLTGTITYGMALPIIMGQNIGTCVTALISSIGVSKNAKRVAAVHICFNLIGTVICLVLLFGLNAIISLSFMDYTIGAVGIAMCHSLFNIFTTVILFPFQKQLERLAVFLVKDSKSAEEYTFLDDRLLQSPSFAIAECANFTGKMCNLAHSTAISAMKLINQWDSKIADEILAAEDKLDNYEDKLGSFLVKISSKDLSDKDSQTVSKLLHSIGDFERIGDHCVNLLSAAREMHEKQLSFSTQASNEIAVATAALTEILDITSAAFNKNDPVLAERVEPLEEVIDQLMVEIKDRHIARLKAGKCTIELGFILSDLMNNYERISDHCSNIAVCVIEISQERFDTHQYLHSIKSGSDKGFTDYFNDFSKKYTII